MDSQGAINFLFSIVNEIKRSFEKPVILVTMQDYAESVFKTMLEIRTTLLRSASAGQVADIVNTFHLEWLQAVQDIEAFKKRIRETSRDHISKAADFTVECSNKRVKYFNNLIDQLKNTMAAEENHIMQDDLEMMSEMHDNFVASLRDKQKHVYTIADPTEYYYKILDETEELLYWLDTLYDNLAIQFSKVVGLKFPELTTQLSKTLQQIIEEVADPSNPESQKMEQALRGKTRALSAMIHLNTGEDLEIRNIVEKIKLLENRIARLKCDNSSAVMALQHKTIYLEERLTSLENIRQSLSILKNKHKEHIKPKHAHIFDHLLPIQERCRLVEDLVKLWATALSSDQDVNSIVSILSVTTFKEVFNDELGTYTVDKYGRKLYKGEDGKLYQANEGNQLVPLKDDEKRIYFYDDCGRFFYNDNNERIYKAHDNASEYCINGEGLMLKVKEYREGKEYLYDDLGRFYINESGKRVYCDTDGEIYENDGLGNLVRVRSPYENYEILPKEPVVSADSMYLRYTVGAALKKCIAEVVLHQPNDPVLFLANCLENYRRCQQTKQERMEERQQMIAEQERLLREAYQATTALGSQHSIVRGSEHTSATGEQSHTDKNLDNYHTHFEDNIFG